MRFKLESERLQHPQGKLIPIALWNDLFNDEISDSQLILIQTPIKKILSNQTLLDTHQDQAEKALVCIFSGNPGALVEDLIQVATLLKLSSKTLLLVALSVNCLSLVKNLVEKEPQLIQEMIQANYGAFRYAAASGHIEVLRYLEEKAPALIQEMIQADRYYAYRYAASQGHIEVLCHLEKQAPELIQEMIEAWDYNAYRYAASHGQLDVLRHIEKQAPELIQQMIQERDYNAFSYAAANGHLDVLLHLEKQAPELIQQMIKAKDYTAFGLAASNGQLEVLRHLEKQAPELILEMIKARNYLAFLWAALDGLLEVLRLLEEKAPDLIQEMIKARDYKVFSSAAEKGHLKVMCHLEEKAPELIQEMIKADNYAAFRYAAASGHVEVLRYLEEKAPELIQQMIQENDFTAFREAAVNGQLKVLCHLEEKAPELIQKMIKAHRYEAFRYAAASGHVEVLRHLEEKAPELIHEMIQADDYDAFRDAASHGHLEVLRHLEEKAPYLIQEMLKPHRIGSAFHFATQNGHLETAAFLLSHHTCFAYEEQHYTEYQTTINPFVTDKLVSLRAHRQLQEDINPNVVFDITAPNGIRLCFYIIRNLIRRNDPSLEDDLRFLIQIPAVRALLHTAVTPNYPNELLRLAFNLGNDDAARILLAVPAVRELAEANNFYQQEAREGRDLRDLAQDHESSMHALTQGEKKRMNAVLKLYQPVINQISVPVLMKQLREQLLARYAKNPALIVVEGKEIILPATWDELNALKLKKPDYELALKAYYQNKDHSAWRYFLKPNPWMAENAEYIEVNPHNPRERYSTFEEYQPLITMLWLAAQDETQPATENHTITGRLTHFIDELAHLGRAHNWDKSRIKPGTELEEEYDDLEGDKPSCYSGVKRRLFQSVVGHSLLKILTMDDLKQELRCFVRDHVAECINKGDKKQLKQAYQNYIVSLDLADAAPLKILDISAVQREQFIMSLEKKYGDQFSREAVFSKYINVALSVPKDSPQVLDLVGVAKLDDLFSLPQVASTYQEKLNNCGRLGATILLQIERLQQAEHSINPYWINSTKKLKAIIHSIDSLSEDINEEELDKLIKNPEAALYQALNIQRLSPLTFLGRLGWNHAKSLQVVQEASSTQPVSELH